MEKTENKDKTLDLFKKFVPYLRGALWWCANDLIKERNPAFNKNDDRKGHPLLSLRKGEVVARGDGVPMLVGTTGDKMSEGRKRRCIEIVGMTKVAPDHRTYFGSIIEPGMYSVAELIDGTTPKKGEHVFKEKGDGCSSRNCEKAYLARSSIYAHRTMLPNWDKPMANENEMRRIDRFCLDHRL